MKMRVQRCVSPMNNMSESSSKVLKNSNRTAECPQILMYLERLQHLVPTCPKDRPVNKLELIHLRQNQESSKPITKNLKFCCPLRAKFSEHHLLTSVSMSFRD
ncbi:hypothetical protein FHG87_013248 [Trinorchestia longiramus]|nr:hypothetical protein FHG87_013248 [Trinorchestia longiramus]